MAVTCSKCTDKKLKKTIGKQNNCKGIQQGWKNALLCKCLLWEAHKGKGCQDLMVSRTVYSRDTLGDQMLSRPCNQLLPGSLANPFCFQRVCQIFWSQAIGWCSPCNFKRNPSCNSAFLILSMGIGPPVGGTGDKCKQRAWKECKIR